MPSLRGEPPFEVTFLVSDRSGGNRFFDLLIEGISLLRTERTEIGAMLDRRGGDIDALIADLRGEPPFEVTFLVSDRSGGNRFFDLLIEGISLLRTERTEIGAMLDRRGGDLDALVADLRRAG